jgi:hypothetical protein
LTGLLLAKSLSSWAFRLAQRPAARSLAFRYLDRRAARKAVAFAVMQITVARRGLRKSRNRIRSSSIWLRHGTLNAAKVVRIHPTERLAFETQIECFSKRLLVARTGKSI